MVNQLTSRPENNGNFHAFNLTLTTTIDLQTFSPPHDGVEIIIRIAIEQKVTNIPTLFMTWIFSPTFWIGVRILYFLLQLVQWQILQILPHYTVTRNLRQNVSFHGGENDLPTRE